MEKPPQKNPREIIIDEIGNLIIDPKRDLDWVPIKITSHFSELSQDDRDQISEKLLTLYKIYLGQENQERAEVVNNLITKLELKNLGEKRLKKKNCIWIGT